MAFSFIPPHWATAETWKRMEQLEAKNSEGFYALNKHWFELLLKTVVLALILLGAGVALVFVATMINNASLLIVPLLIGIVLLGFMLIRIWFSWRMTLLLFDDESGLIMRANPRSLILGFPRNKDDTLHDINDVNLDPVRRSWIHDFFGFKYDTLVVSKEGQKIATYHFVRDVDRLLAIQRKFKGINRRTEDATIESLSVNRQILEVLRRIEVKLDMLTISPQNQEIDAVAAEMSTTDILDDEADTLELEPVVMEDGESAS